VVWGYTSFGIPSDGLTCLSRHMCLLLVGNVTPRVRTTQLEIASARARLTIEFFYDSFLKKCQLQLFLEFTGTIIYQSFFCNIYPMWDYALGVWNTHLGFALIYVQQKQQERHKSFI